jgi:hypothetical protein
MLEFAFISLTKASDVRTRLILREEGLKPIPFRCARYVRYEGAMTVIGINIVGLMMFLRCVRPNLCVGQSPVLIGFQGKGFIPQEHGYRLLCCRITRS